MKKLAVLLFRIFLLVLMPGLFPVDAADAFGQELVTHGWSGELRDGNGARIDGGTVRLLGGHGEIVATTSADGTFRFAGLAADKYTMVVVIAGVEHRYAGTLELSTESLPMVVTVAKSGEVKVASRPEESATATGGEKLSSQTVSAIPLNKRDFSQLLLLAAGTMTDSNGQTNFTQQFAINGQRGVEATFAMDGADTSDPEMGGAAFSNFNVDAVEEIRSSSGWMPAEIGRGAAGFTNVITRSGAGGFYGSVFEFLRNSALDARNYFDHPTLAEPGRIPPFRRNEFGFTNGGPIVIPHVYDGSGKTFYFGQYQGFRQVLGTSQVFPVPTAQERAGIDTTAYAGDTLTVTPDPKIAAVLARYPLPNNPTGTYGVYTFAGSSKVTTNANQFSLRLDQVLPKNQHVTARFNFNNLYGPTTNPDQTAIDPSFGIVYVDHQRNFAVTYTKTVSPKFDLESGISVTRTTPQFPTPNRTDPAIKFNDGRYEAFNSAGGSVAAAFGNLFQARQAFTWTTSKHVVKGGGEVRVNRDTTYFGTSPNGEYDFGGGGDTHPQYSPVEITSASHTHDIHVGDKLPDTLTALLTGSAYVYTTAVAPPFISGGSHIGPAAISRNGFAVYLQDTYKISPRIVLDYGLRYEIYTPIVERAHRTAGFLGPDGGTQYAVNPQPGYRTQKNGFAPRVQVDWRVTGSLHLHAGGGITTIPPNIWQDNFLTGAVPFVIYPHVTATAAAPDSLRIPDHPRATADLLFDFRRRCLREREDEDGGGQHGARCGAIPEGPGGVDAGSAIHPAEPGGDKPEVRQRIFADLDGWSGETVRQDDGGCGVCGNGFGEAAADLVAEWVLGSRASVCAVYAVRCEWRRDWRVWDGAGDRGDGALQLPRAADFALGPAAAWRAGGADQLHVVEGA